MVYIEVIITEHTLSRYLLQCDSTEAGSSLMKTLAVDIGGSKLSVARFDGDQLVQRHRQPTERAGGPMWMLEQIVRIASQWPAAERCGVGFGGPVDFPEQRVAKSFAVEGWSGLALGEQLRRRLGIPVVIDNDGNVGALGELRHGAGRPLRSLLYVTISTGIGAGLVLDGRVWRGSGSRAGELGHITVRPEGPRCACGQAGCLERLCSGLWLEHDYQRPASELFQDPSFVGRYVRDLALGLKSAMLLLDVAAVLIGGGISRAGDALFVPLREELRRQLPAALASQVTVLPASLGDDVILFGAKELAQEL